MASPINTIDALSNEKSKYYKKAKEQTLLVLTTIITLKKSKYLV